ncbi:nucleoside hydrolase [Nocardia sp. NPDC050193]
MNDRTAKPAEHTSRIDARVPAAMVICTDAAYDPDDAVSLALAASIVEDLTVITSDETGGRRARWTRGYLDALGRSDVEVAAGPDIGEAHRFLMDDMIAGISVQSRDVLGAVVRACERSSGPITWVGQGLMTNLAAVVHAEPGVADRIQLTQQGGWLDHYRDKTRASHNLRWDSAAAGVALRTVVRPQLLLSDFTGVDDITVTADGELCVR